MYLMKLLKTVPSLTTFLVCLLWVSSAVATPVIFCKDGPGIDLVNDGCISGTARGYTGGGDGIYSNANGGDPEAKVEQAILGATGTAVDIFEIGNSEDNPSLFTFTPGDPTTSQSGTWTVNAGTLVAYITVKAANSFALFEISPKSSTGSYDTAGILTNGGSQPNASHITFWGTETEVPEPASIILLGAGLMGVVRSRRSKA